MTGFDLNHNRKPTKTSRDSTYAKYLQRALTKKRKLQRLVNHQKWKSEFRQLREQLAREGDNSNERLQKVFSWYTSNIGKCGVPRAYSAASFRRHFFRIESSMRRDKSFMREIQVSDDAKWIAEECGGLIWPNEEKRDELPFIQLCLDGYRQYLHSLKTRLVKANRYQRRLLEFCLTLWEPREFVVWWMLQVHRIAWNWDKWGGELWCMAFQPHSRLFLSELYKRTVGEGFTRNECEEAIGMKEETGYAN